MLFALPMCSIIYRKIIDLDILDRPLFFRGKQEPTNKVKVKTKPAASVYFRFQEQSPYILEKYLN